jgi:hypothetical protein
VFKLRKLLSISLLVVVPTTGFFFATSCAEVDPKGEEDYTSDYAKFINDRTFSIISAYPNGSGYLGTA